MNIGFEDLFILLITMLTVILIFATTVFLALPTLRIRIRDIENDIRDQKYRVSDKYVINLHRRISKRLFDVCFSLVTIAAMCPIYMIIALMLKLSGCNKIIHSVDIVGYKGKKIKKNIFNIFADDEILTGDNDLKFTSLGRMLRETGLEKLPIYFQILKGEFSVVGISCVNYSEANEQQKRIYNYGKPGLISLAQIARCNKQERLIYDDYYLKNNGLILDLIVVLSCSAIVLIKEE